MLSLFKNCGGLRRVTIINLQHVANYYYTPPKIIAVEVLPYILYAGDIQWSKVCFPIQKYLTHISLKSTCFAFLLRYSGCTWIEYKSLKAILSVCVNLIDFESEDSPLSDDGCGAVIRKCPKLEILTIYFSSVDLFRKPHFLKDAFSESLKEFYLKGFNFDTVQYDLNTSFPNLKKYYFK